MSISKKAQRVLHVLAQGGAIHFERGSNGKVRMVSCLTCDGHKLTDCTPTVFERLRRRRLIWSSRGHPYRITRDGLHAVRPQLDNR